MQARGALSMGGSLSIDTHAVARKAPWWWKIRNLPNLLRAWRVPLALVLKMPTFYGTLRMRLTHPDGTAVDYGLVSARVVTTDFCEFLAAQMITETSVFGDFKYHDSGEGVTPAAIGDHDMEATDGEARSVGTQVQGASAVAYKSIATITYTTPKAITEHGLFNVLLSNPVMLDRHVFAVVNVAALDSITFTYEITFVSGG
jgi:hypothetical protein